MNKLHKRRLYFIMTFALGISIAAGLILYALKQNISVFMTPSQITSNLIDYHCRLGGVVKKNSVRRDKEGLGVEFAVTDFKSEVVVRYQGILPDLFREGKGVIAEGHLTSQGVFAANVILAKHDENYMPKDVYQALRKNQATQGVNR